MVVSSIDSPHAEYKDKNPDQNTKGGLGFRQLVVLTIGALDRPINSRDLYNLSRNLAHQLKESVNHEFPRYQIFLTMINKLIKQGVVMEKPLKDMRAYGVILSPRGMGELDGLLFSKQAIMKPWYSFRSLSMAAGG